MSKPIPAITSLCFDTAGWLSHDLQTTDKSWLWETPDHDLVTANFYDEAPNLPRCSTMLEFRNAYTEAFRKADGGKSDAEIVQLEIAEIAGVPAVLLLFRMPMKEGGFLRALMRKSDILFQGTYTWAFRDFSFVICVKCSGQGAGKSRNTIIDGNVQLENSDPNSPSHGQDFPTHPLDRARRLLVDIARSATLDSALKTCPLFPLPAQ
jgi:hypothetical protein